jgi:hypothetical protein
MITGVVMISPAIADAAFPSPVPPAMPGSLRPRQMNIRRDTLAADFVAGHQVELDARAS